MKRYRTGLGSALVSSAGEDVSSSRTWMSCGWGAPAASRQHLCARILDIIMAAWSQQAAAVTRVKGRPGFQTYRLAALAPQKFVAARRRNQHSRRVRYPEGNSR
jgi:hypothetical protein